MTSNNSARLFISKTRCDVVMVVDCYGEGSVLGQLREVLSSEKFGERYEYVTFLMLHPGSDPSKAVEVLARRVTVESAQHVTFTRRDNQQEKLDIGVALQWLGGFDSEVEYDLVIVSSTYTNEMDTVENMHFIRSLGVEIYLFSVWGAAPLPEPFPQLEIAKAASVARHVPIADLRESMEHELQLNLVKIDDYKLVLLKAVVLNTPVYLGDSLLVELTLRNDGVFAIPQARIIIRENDYFERTSSLIKDPIKCGEVNVKQVAVPGKGLKDPLLLPEYLHLYLKCHIAPTMRYSLKLLSEIFLSDFLNIKSAIPHIPFLNVLCFGIAGSGKSSFINSLLTLFYSKRLDAAAVMRSSTHVTQCVTRFPVDSIEGLETVPLRLFDIWGLDPKNFKDNILLDVLEGRTPDGFQMMDRNNNLLTFNEDNYWRIIEGRIHSVLFFMPPTITESRAFINSLLRNFQLCRETYKMNPLIIVTRHDQVSGQEEERRLLRSLCADFKIPEHSIYLYENYTDQHEKSMRIDRKTMHILNHIVQSCTTYMMHAKLMCPACNEQELLLSFDCCPSCDYNFLRV